MRFRVLLPIFAAVLLLASPIAALAEPAAHEALEISSASDFSAGQLTNLRITGGGDGALLLGDDPSFQSSAYNPNPYFGMFETADWTTSQLVNEIQVSWAGQDSSNIAVRLSVRSSKDGVRWSEWQGVESGRWSALKRAGDRLQVRVTLLSAAPGSGPAVESISVLARLNTDLPQSTLMDEDRAPVYRVYATREGLVGSRTANGHIIQPDDRFVALPSTSALSKKDGHEYQVLVSYKGKRVILPVWDLGPWNIHDNYWDEDREMWKDLPTGVPEAQAAYFMGYNDGKDERGRRVKIPSGIDIADGAFIHDLGMTQSDWVDVTFLWEGTLPEELENVELQGLPTDPVPAITDNPRVMFFPETGHNVGFEFLDFWQQNGGLDMFGLPLTDGVKVGSATAQYFERARFEYRPNRPEGERVVLGRLGSALTDGRTFEEVPPFPETATQRYFEETGHSLSNGFLHFWNQHNGEELFGAPISEEMGLDDPYTGQHLVVQYFEKARLEFHPELQGTPYEVELGLLGKEFLQRKGWMN